VLLLVLYVPLYMWRMAEDKRMGGTSPGARRFQVMPSIHRLQLDSKECTP